VCRRGLEENAITDSTDSIWLTFWAFYRITNYYHDKELSVRDAIMFEKKI
jgi:hypothetical protein